LIFLPNDSSAAGEVEAVLSNSDKIRSHFMGSNGVFVYPNGPGGRVPP
jgi:hypothetical protein